MLGEIVGNVRVTWWMFDQGVAIEYSRSRRTKNGKGVGPTENLTNIKNAIVRGHVNGQKQYEVLYTRNKSFKVKDYVDLGDAAYVCVKERASLMSKNSFEISF